MDEKNILQKADLNTRQKKFVERQNLCPLCNTQLDISTESYLEDFFLREEARCPECELLARIKDHKIN
ncbi:MAG: hypothetical protein K1X29_04445 [Bdellovibrionales bacterium]|nr:hypothetical protein [Bdellovibrionales bacterium]